MPKPNVTKLKMAISFGHKLLCLWLLGDVAYTTLPIATIAIINIALNQPFTDFLLIPEWSFASIVFYGLSIRYLIEIKVKYQKDFSYKLDTGTQLFILMLITSVITLSFVILSQKGLKINTQFLEAAQLTLFILGIVILLMVTMAKIDFNSKKNKLPDGLSKMEYYNFLKTTFSDVNNDLSYLKYALDKSKDIKLIAWDDYDASNLYDQEELRDIDNIVVNIDKSLKEVTVAFEYLKNNPPKLK